jgi:hypothetical protein
MLSLHESLDEGVGILVILRGRIFDVLDFLLRRRDIRGDGVLSDHDGGGCVVAPRDRITQLPGVILHRLGRPLDSSSRGFGRIP